MNLPGKPMIKLTNLYPFDSVQDTAHINEVKTHRDNTPQNYEIDSWVTLVKLANTDTELIQLFEHLLPL